jgi:N-acetylglucosaminyldiphosphoundecaprenol N-acetyl-beta-D-mannosaminyltransferase
MSVGQTDLPRAAVLDVPLAIADYDSVLDWMQATILERRSAYMSAAAVNLVMSAREDPAVMAAVLGATLVVPDGQPLVWALHLLGHRRATRVYGPDLMALYCAAHSRTPMYLYGGRNEAALGLLARRLRERFPELAIVGSHAPPFRPLTDEEQQVAAADINASGADVVWVGTGQPRQELWMAAMRPHLRAPLLVGVGAAFDFHAGLVRQAPPWMGRHGLEWTYRLAREPRRLWRRYLNYNPRFVVAFARQYVEHRRGGRGRT